MFEARGVKIVGLEQFELVPWANWRRKDRLNPMIEELTSAIEQEGKKRPDVLQLDDISWCAPTRAVGSGSTGVV
jgi:hypothetical protein